MEKTLWIDSLARGEERRKGEALPHSDTPGMKKSLSTVKNRKCQRRETNDIQARSKKEMAVGLEPSNTLLCTNSMLLQSIIPLGSRPTAISFRPSLQ